MKTLYTALALFLGTTFCFGQNFQPFHESMSKRFMNTDDSSDDDYFFHVDSLTVSGDTTIFYQYHTKQFTGMVGMYPPGCSFWGGSTGEMLDTTWLGNQLNWNSATQELLLKNESNEPLTFDFGLTTGNTSQFYTNGTTNYDITYASAGTESFFGVSDSVKTFTISATDNGGNPIPSQLNGFEIKLSKNYGLLTFINTLVFPSVEQGQELRGQINPTLGDYQLTYDECYPWQVNDVLQYSNYRNEGFNGPPPYASYQTVTVVDRIETADSVKLYFSSIIQVTSQGTSVSAYGMDTSPLFFKKGTPISELPWNKSHVVYPIVNVTEDSTEHCGFHGAFSFSESFTVYCDSCLCYGSADGFGQSVEYNEYVKNYGLFKRSYSEYGPLWDVGSGSSTLVYSNVNGVECGTFWNATAEIPTFVLSVSPNPTKDQLTIVSDHLIDQIKVIDLTGRSVLILSGIYQNKREISLASFQKGAYILEVTSNGFTQKKTIVRE